jgi:hypothetical protein
MTDFQYLEEIAARIKENREQLYKIDDELSKVNARIHELPRRSEVESGFAKLVGSEYYDELSEHEKVRDSLVAQRDSLASAIETDVNGFITGFASSDLVIPIDPEAGFSDGNATYRYRNGIKYINLFGLLSEVVGLSLPMVIKDVMLSPSEIVIKASEEFEAKKKFINAVNEIQKTLSIKKRKDSFSY